MTKAIKKAATKKATSVKRKPGIKYADKSACQSEQVAIFNKIKKLLVVYGKGNIKVRSNEGTQVALVSEKMVEIQEKKEKRFGLLCRKERGLQTCFVEISKRQIVFSYQKAGCRNF
jgi:hypothetical protein